MASTFGCVFVAAEAMRCARIRPLASALAAAISGQRHSFEPLIPLRMRIPLHSEVPRADCERVVAVFPCWYVSTDVFSETNKHCGGTYSGGMHLNRINRSVPRVCICFRGTARITLSVSVQRSEVLFIRARVMCYILPQDVSGWMKNASTRRSIGLRKNKGRPSAG